MGIMTESHNHSSTNFFHSNKLFSYSVEDTLWRAKFDVFVRQEEERKAFKDGWYGAGSRKINDLVEQPKKMHPYILWVLFTWKLLASFGISTMLV